MHGIDQLLTGKSMNPRLVSSSASAHLGDDYKIVRIRMKCPLNDLIGHMRTVVVAGIDMIDTGVNRLSQNSNRHVNITWWSPYFRTGKLHCAITHPVHGQRGASEPEIAAKVRP